MYIYNARVNKRYYTACDVVFNFRDVGFPAFGTYLNQTGRPIVYSCQWPMYARYYGGTVGLGIFWRSNACRPIHLLLSIIYESMEDNRNATLDSHLVPSLPPFFPPETSSFSPFLRFFLLSFLPSLTTSLPDSLPPWVPDSLPSFPHYFFPPSLIPSLLPSFVLFYNEKYQHIFFIKFKQDMYSLGMDHVQYSFWNFRINLISFKNYIKTILNIFI